MNELNKHGLTENQKDIVIQMLNNGVNSTRFICEGLIEEQPFLDVRYISGKPKIYFAVCQYLEELLRHGRIEFIGSDELRDRFYKVLNK